MPFHSILLFCFLVQRNLLFDLAWLPHFVMKKHISLIIITTIINTLIAIDTNSRQFLSILNEKISKEFLMSRYVRVMILLMWIFLRDLDK